MPNTDFSEGIYTLVSAKTSDLVIDCMDGKVTVDQFMGCQTQQWQLKKAFGSTWSFQNVSTGHFLGMKDGETVGNHRELYEVQGPFPWQLKRGDPPSRTSLWVPFTNHVVDLPQEIGHPRPGTVLYLYERHQVLHQEWHLCKDLRLAASKALLNGRTYCILNAQSKTAISAVKGKAAGFSVEANKDDQNFLAIETENGWAFRNVKSQEYLGVKHSVALFPDGGVRLLLVEKEFTRAVLPHHENTSKFKIWLPFTGRSMDLHWGFTNDDTPIHLHTNNGLECQWWNFQPVSEALDGNIDNPGAFPGPLEF